MSERPRSVIGRMRGLVSTRQSAKDLFWLFGAPAGVVGLLFAFGAHF